MQKNWQVGMCGIEDIRHDETLIYSIYVCSVVALVVSDYD